MNELFLWAVVNGYHELSMWLWDKDEGDDSFVRVLIAEEINLQISEKMKDKNIPMKPQKFMENYK